MYTQRGNVLFLILIAVALFAALSYAVTQSTRSGGGDASNEKNLVNSAWLPDYTNSVIVALTRLTMSGAFTNDTVCFLRPAAAAFSVPANIPCNIFHPAGGGVPYALQPDSVVDAAGATAAGANPHVFIGRREVVGIGSTTGTAASAETMMVFTWVRADVCKKINSRLGLPDPTTLDSNSGIGAFATEATPLSYGATIPVSGSVTYDADAFGTVGFLPSFNAQQEGCAMNNGYYFYFRVLIAR